MSVVSHGFRFGLRGILALLICSMGIWSAGVATTPVAAQGAATINVSNVDESGSPLAFSRFTVTDSNGVVYGPLETQPGTGSVSFTVDPGDGTVTFTVVEDTPPPCGIAPDPIDTGPFLDGDSADVSFTTTFDANCNLGAIAGYLYSCPDGFDGSAADYATWSSTCATPVNGATFTLVNTDSGQTWNPVTGAYGTTARAPVVGLPPSAYTLALSTEQDQAAFCLSYDSANPALAPEPSSVEQMDLSSGAATISLSGNRVACDFFLYTAPADEEPSATATDVLVEAAAADSAIEIHKAMCVAGYDGSDYYNDCHANGVADITFSISGPNGFSDSMDTVIPSSPGPGVAEFTGLESGEYAVSEDTIPGDFNSSYVYCSLSDSDTQVEYTENDTGGIVFDLPAETRVICDWYNIPDLQFEPASVDVVKRTCNENVDASSSFDDLVANCSKTDDVGYVLTRTDDDSSVSGTTGDDAAGQVIFTDVAPGSYTLYEDVPLEFVTPVAFCGTSLDNLEAMEVESGTVSFQIDGSGDTIYCRWFNIPENLKGDSGSISIEKYLCPAGTTSGYAATCGDYPFEGVTFDVDGPGDLSLQDVTANDGSISFSDLPAGDYLITESDHGDQAVSVYVVGCQSNGQYFPFTYDDSTGLRIRLTLSQDQEVNCGWYNVPPVPKPVGPTGSITVHKLICSGKSNNQYDWSKDCKTYTGGAGFRLSDKSGVALISGTTNSSGVLVFSGLAAGTYTLEETTAKWCHAEAESVDSSGKLLVTDGQNSNVYIYNCGTQTVDRLPATGTGNNGGGSHWLLIFFGGAATLLLMGMMIWKLERSSVEVKQPK